jgi:lysine-N-methylase
MTNQSNLVHPFIEEVVLTPSYVTRFQCLGAECPDTCCSGWNVALDSATHDAYMHFEAPEWKSKFKKYIKVHDVPTEQSASTILREADTGNCHFLSDGWCSVQSALGEDLISNTCSSYPRLSVKLGDTLFQSMSLSCPEAARLALTSPDAFDFQAPVLQIRQHELRNITSPWALSLQQMQSIHTFALQVAKTSGLSLVERLVCLGLLCENLSGYFKANNFEGIDSVLAGIEELILSGQVAQLVESLEGAHSTQATFFRSLWLLGRNSQANAYQLTIQNMVDRAAQCEEGVSAFDLELCTGRYTQGLSTLHAVLQSKPTLLENAVLNDMLQDLFPFSGAEPMHNFLKLVTRFGFLRWLLANVCFELGEKVTVDDLVQAAQQFYRKFRHNAAFANALHETLIKAGWSTLDKAIPILKA